MSDHPVIPLRAEIVDFVSPEYEQVAAWPFEDRFVSRLLSEDIPQRMQYSNCRLWRYLNPNSDNVGFGTLEVSRYYSEYTSGLPHLYIPLLALNPNAGRYGYGTSIVKHLIREAAKIMTGIPLCYPLVFLDVYTDSLDAIRLYDKCGFLRLVETAILDEQAEGKPYYIMTKWLGDIMN